MSEHLTDASASSSLLPTPNAYESTPTDEWVDEAREAGIAPHERTLSRIAPTVLLPTPNAWLGRRPENSMADPERAASREHEGSRGKRSVELPDALAAEVELLPTPVATDGAGSDKIRESRTGGSSLRQMAGEKLLPTPTTQDAKNTGGPSQHERNTPPLNAEVQKLLPTPVANEQNPGSGTELRAALVHGEGRRNETGTDTMGRPNRGRPRLLPTPTAQDAKQNALNPKEAERNPNTMWATMHRLLPTPQAADGTGGRQETTAMRNAGKRPSGQKATLTLGTAASLRGELTSRPFADGSKSSDGQLPGQLTIEDA